MRLKTQLLTQVRRIPQQELNEIENIITREQERRTAEKNKKTVGK